MRVINRDYRGKDCTTDVIAFAMGEGEFGSINEQVLGDIVISLDRALLQASERGASLKDEIDFLLIHGILHLHGYDHERNEDDRLLMEAKEREIALNLGNAL